jgi:hypothetical protein
LANLLSFGIPIDRFPYDFDDLQIKLRSHSRFLVRQKVLEKMIMAGTFDQWRGAHIPGVKDILIGTGAHVSEHVGNRWLWSILEEYLEEYNSAIAHGKQKIDTIKKVVVRVEGDSGRFLKQWENLWCQTDQASDKHEKIIHVFRGMNKRVCRQQSQSEQQQQKLQDQQTSSVALTESNPPDCKRPRVVG